MPGSTAKGYPYPLGTEPVQQGDDAIKALAEAVDTHAGRAASGVATLALPTANTPNSVAVSFPAGRFTAAPAVVLSRQTAIGVSAVLFYWPNGISATGFTLNGVSSAIGGAASIGWIAVQAP